MPFPPTRDHKISLQAAADLTRRYREGAGLKAKLGDMFPRDVYERILAQPGCAGIRAYEGKRENGERVIILVGVDSTGKDMTSGTLFEDSFPCPPYCDPDELNS